MTEKTKFKLHYGGQEFDVPNGDLLDDVDMGTPGTVTVDLGNGGWLTFAVGPGVPIAIVAKVGRPTRVYV